MPRLPDIASGIVTEGVGSGRTRAPGAARLSSARLNTGGAPGSLRVGKGGISVSSAAQLKAQGVQARGAVAQTRATPEALAQPISPEVVMSGMALLNRSAINFQERQDDADAGDALLRAREDARKIYLNVDAEGKATGYATTAGKASGDLYGGYESAIQSAYAKYGANLNSNAQQKYIARSMGFKERDLNAGASHRVRQLEEYEKGQRFVSQQALLQDMDNKGVEEQFQPGVDGGPSPFEQMIMAYPSAVEQEKVRASTYDTALQNVYQTQGITAAKDFNDRNEGSNTPEGRNRMNTWLDTQVEADKARAERNSKEIRDTQRNAGLSSMTNSMAENYNSLAGEELGQKLKAVESFYEGDTNAYQSTINSQNRIISNLLANEAGKPNATYEGIKAQWDQKVSDAKDAGVELSVETRNHADNILQSFRTKDTQAQITNKSKLRDGGLGLVGQSEDISTQIMAFGGSQETADLLQRINVQNGVAPTAERAQTQGTYERGLTLMAEEGGYPHGSPARDILFEYAAEGNISNEGLGRILEAQDTSSQRPKISEDIKSAHKDIKNMASSGLLVGGKGSYTPSQLAKLNDEERAEAMEVNVQNSAAELELRDALKAWKEDNRDTSARVFVEKYMEEHSSGTSGYSLFNPFTPAKTATIESVLPEILNQYDNAAPQPDLTEQRSIAIPVHAEVFSNMTEEDKALYEELKRQNPGYLRSVPAAGLPSVMDIAREQGVK